MHWIKLSKLGGFSCSSRIKFLFDLKVSANEKTWVSPLSFYSCDARHDPNWILMKAKPRQKTTASAFFFFLGAAAGGRWFNVGLVLQPKGLQVPETEKNWTLIPTDVTFNTNRGRGFFMINEG